MPLVEETVEHIYSRMSCLPICWVPFDKRSLSCLLIIGRHHFSRNSSKKFFYKLLMFSPKEIYLIEWANDFDSHCMY